ncbi:carbon storage regulator [Pseudomonas amygdali]|uniref:carbon storage regulator n=1 Tax=Pseudomonas amygdali TaxID=47877 RepID=UPI0009BE6848|nr:carbon storage regulator [Pseudomonas amygdali]UNO28813.1 carbon storage regulator [Pseudomonas amygdali pv. aesculi]WGQ03717.1 carbon storage regulator [Pseudomonas amygdali pv. aesculi]
MLSKIGVSEKPGAVHQIQVLSVSEDTGDVRIQIKALDVVKAQNRNVDNEVTDGKPGPVITHKRRWRSLATQ